MLLKYKLFFIKCLLIHGLKVFSYVQFQFVFEMCLYQGLLNSAVIAILYLFHVLI